MIRIIGNLVALVINIAAAFVLVRKLDYSDYALYQTLTKRGIWLGSLIVLLLSDWAYRYNAQRIPGSWRAGLALALISSVYAFVVGVLVALYLHAGFLLALLAGAATAIFVSYNLMRGILNALRPVRLSVVPVIYRLMYTTLIIVLVYFAQQGVSGALMSIVIAGSVVLVLMYRWGLEAKPPDNDWPRLIRTWLRHSFVYVPSTIAVLLASSDAILAYHFWGTEMVAAFFATLMIFSLARESITAGMGYITTYLLQGGDEKYALRGLSVVLGLVTPILVFIVTHPVHAMYLINP